MGVLLCGGIHFRLQAIHLQLAEKADLQEYPRISQPKTAFKGGKTGFHQPRCLFAF
jgi:hypothetical protein